MKEICTKYARNMPKYAVNMAVKCHKYAAVQLYASNMHKICKYIDCISQICKRYAGKIILIIQNMPEICLVNMQLYASNVQVMLIICKKYAKNMQLYRLY